MLDENETAVINDSKNTVMISAPERSESDKHKKNADYLSKIDLAIAQQKKKNDAGA